MQDNFAAKLIKWQQQHGRHHLPWQVKDAYCVWLSEIMLQQTQVTTVLNYYPRFIKKFPDVAALANATEDDVLALWSGLGYYARARNLHKAAKQVVNEFDGQFPQSRLELQQLCGIGRSTAAAICAFAFSQKEAILDGNVKRVLCRVFALDGDPADRQFEQALWQKAESLLPDHQLMQGYTQGLMDLGALVCLRSKPKCHNCPMKDICLAHMQNLTATLPRKKQKKTVPVKSLYWLLIQNEQGEIIVERRKSQGIWGGLYCLPTFENLQEAEQFCQRFKISLTDFIQLPEISHRLTHFLLQITPYSVQSVNITPSGYQYLALHNLLEKALPTPLLKLLQKDFS